MDKKEIIKLLKEALFSEEKVIPIYSKHLSSSVSWVGIEQKKKERVKEILGQLEVDSRRHKNTVEKILEDLQQG